MTTASVSATEEFSNLYPDALLPFSEQPNIMKTAAYLKMSGETFAMRHCQKFSRSSYILASWTDGTSNINLTGNPRPGQTLTLIQNQKDGDQNQ